MNAKNVYWFLLVNLAVVLVLTLVWFGIGFMITGWTGYMDEQGINYPSLIIFCVIFGMGGSFISLWLSKPLAKSALGVSVVDASDNDPQIAWYVNIVHEISCRAGLEIMPEVGIFNSTKMNAFATGKSRSDSLVAVSSGLLNTMTKDEVEAVVAHEVAHIANGDMLTMVLLQGVLNTFVMAAARIIAAFVSRGDDGVVKWWTHFAVVFVLEIVFGVLASMITASFSRYREYRADAGSADLVGREKMIAALQCLKDQYDPEPEKEEAMMAFRISSSGKFARIFASHPALENRIARLQQK